MLSQKVQGDKKWWSTKERQSPLISGRDDKYDAKYKKDAKISKFIKVQKN